MALGCMLLLICQVRAATLMQLAFILLICVAVPKLVFVLADIIGRGICWHHPNMLPNVHKVATALAVGMAALQVYGTAWGWRKLQVENTTLHIAGLPAAFKGYRIVQISDIHLGTYSGDTSLMQSMVDSINQLTPDLIVFTGDMVNTASSETLPYIKILGKLHAPDGVMSVLGNHDYCMYHPDSHLRRGKPKSGASYARNASWAGKCCSTKTATLCAVTTHSTWQGSKMWANRHFPHVATSTRP